MRYNYIMLENLENVILDNVLTEEDISGLYKYIGETSACKPVLHKEIGYTWYTCGINRELSDKIESIAKEFYGSYLELTEVCLAQYKLNEDYVPNLKPHFDNFTSGRITIDIQIRSNIDWALYVDGKRFLLKDNQALVFAGTHQPHWREEKSFEGDHFVDMLFCHFTVPGVEALPTEKIEEIESLWKKKLGR